MIHQTNHLPDSDLHDLENKDDVLQDQQNAEVMVSLELWGDTSLRLADSVST
jgi:hypothetical protein